MATIFPSNPPFRTKYPAKWKIGFLLKTRFRLGFYLSKSRFQEKHHKKILLIPLDSTGRCPKRTPMIPDTHRYSSQKIPKFSKNPIKIHKIGPHGPPMGPHGVPWGPLDPILWLDPIPVRAIHRLHGYERGNVVTNVVTTDYA